MDRRQFVQRAAAAAVVAAMPKAPLLFRGVRIAGLLFPVRREADGDGYCCRLSWLAEPACRESALSMRTFILEESTVEHRSPLQPKTALNGAPRTFLYSKTLYPKISVSETLRAAFSGMPRDRNDVGPAQTHKYWFPRSKTRCHRGRGAPLIPAARHQASSTD
jgi:hypothetical protein